MDATGGLTAGQGALLARFSELLRASPHNLLSPRGLSELEQRHFPEGIAFARALPAVDRVLDIGSGGGLPGVVVAIMRPDLRVHLLEATSKKVDFLSGALADLGLPVTVHHGRAEDLARSDLAGSFDVVCARAVAPLVRLIPWCAPYLRPGGRLYAIKGDRWAEELDAAASALTSARMTIQATPTTPTTPGLEGRSTDMPLVVVLERARNLSSGSGFRPSRSQHRDVGRTTKQ